MLNHINKEKINPSRVVLLGGNGFVGQEIFNSLKKENIPTLSISSKDIDLTQESSVEKLSSLLKESDSLVFLSALTPDKGRGIEAFEKNIKMAIHVAKAIEIRTVSHLVYLSSDAVFSMGEPLVTEETTPIPEDLYGLMHLTREKLMAMTFQNTAIIRPTLVYGAKDTHNSYGPNRIRRMADEKKEITLFGGGEETRDHILVTDLAQLILNILKHKSTGQLNAVTGQSISYFDLAKEIASLYQSVKVTLTERKNPITHRHFDNTNVFKCFPSFQFTPLKDGLRIVYDQISKEKIT
ncbi:NAD(P)-dependent oxidoreductase [Alphaproteobacteria bacterium]|nr:NAD(P)-dependent oxidoreductase [Alphaproteobacteria bacterium]